MNKNKEVGLTLVGNKCIYLNEYRIQGKKPYVSENHTILNKKVRVVDVLNALDFDDIKKYVDEKLK